MESNPGERIALILATIILIIGMMDVSLKAAEDSRQRAAAGRGAGRLTATPTPPVGEEPVTPGDLGEIFGGGAPGVQDPVQGTGGRPGGPGGPGAPGPGGPGPGPGPRARPTPSPFQDDPGVNPAASISQPRPGTYTYAGSGPNFDLAIEAAGAGRFREVIRQFGYSFTQEMVWASDTKKLDKLTFSGEGMSSTCDWQPDITVYQMPVARGSTWRGNGSCTMANPGNPTESAEITYEGSSRVIGAQRLTIGGQPVEAWVIETTATITTRSPQGSDQDEQFSRDWVSPAHGVSAKVYSEGAFNPGGSGEYELQNLAPK